MTSTLIRGALGIFTGLPGDAMRARGAIRIADGRISAIGELSAEPGERIIDASGCAIYPGLFRPTITCSRAFSRACAAASTCL